MCQHSDARYSTTRISSLLINYKTVHLSLIICYSAFANINSIILTNKDLSGIEQKPYYTSNTNAGGHKSNGLSKSTSTMSNSYTIQANLSQI